MEGSFDCKCSFDSKANPKDNPKANSRTNPKANSGLPITKRDVIGYIRVSKLVNDGHNIEDIEDMLIDERPIVRSKEVTMSLNGGIPITYKTISEASRKAGIPISTLYKYKIKSNVVHPITFNRNGNNYTLSFEGFENKDNVVIVNPRRLGRAITLY